MRDMSQSQESAHGWRVGAVGGVPVYIGRSWPVIAIAVVFLFGPQIPFGPVAAYGVAAAYAALLLGSVVVHEIGHAVAARGVGARVDRIVVNLWGGHTVFGHSGLRPGSSALVALAGPAGNLLLAALGWLAGMLLEPVAMTMPAAWLLARALLVTNLLVAGFNLLPGLPLDGGHIVEALVWGLTGRRDTSLVVAGWLGRLVAALVAWWWIVRPFFAGERPDLFAIVWVGFIGAFLWQGASQAVRAGRARQAVAAVPLSGVLRPVVGVPVHASGRSVAAALQARPDAVHVVALDPAGRPVGFLDVDALASVPPEHLDQVPATSVLLRAERGWVVTASPQDDITGVVEALAGHHDGESVKQAVLVVDPAGALLGTVTLDAVEAALGG